ncbi:MAG: 50S ribosomal protein L4 [Candidatus Aenigmatarchaeota archaeon]
MKLPVYNIKGEVKATRDFIRVFSTPVRADIINRAVVAEQSNKRQPYGTDPLAGKRTSAHYHGRRKVRHSMMNREMSRMARIHGSGFLHMTARFVPQATKGRKAHPPKTDKVWKKDINKKEHIKAILSAASATAKVEYVSSRGHLTEGIKHIPLVVEGEIESINKTKDFLEILKNLGLEKEIERVKSRKVRSGKGTLRGRKYKKNKGLLVVVSEYNGIEKAVRNIPGIDVINVNDIMAEHLAPGGIPGRLTIWSEKALEKLEKIAG